MAERRGYMVRAAGTPGRPGPVFKIYPYTLRALLDALEGARFQSFAQGPHLVIRIDGDERRAFRRYEGGQEVGL